MQQHDGMSVIWRPGFLSCGSAGHQESASPRFPGSSSPNWLRPPEILLLAAGWAAAEARSLERTAAGIILIDTDGRTVAEAVDAVAALTS